MTRSISILLPPGWEASPSKGYPSTLNSPVLIHLGWRKALRANCFAQEHNPLTEPRLLDLESINVTNH